MRQIGDFTSRTGEKSWDIETGKKRINWLTFNALMAVFKSNEGTKSMLEKLDGFESEVLIALGSTVE